MNQALLYIAAGLTGLWGVAHLFATKGVVAAFGDISPDSRRVITMEWIAEAVALISTAAFVACAAAIEPGAHVSSAVFAVAIGTLVFLAVVSIFTGFRIAFLPCRLCPFIFGLSAVLIAVGAWSRGLRARDTEQANRADAPKAVQYPSSAAGAAHARSVGPMDLDRDREGGSW